jgi:trehalose 6-phosphate synthase
MNFDAANWLAYREANMRFADVVAGFCQAGDMVWVQDYHLMLLPMLLRSIIGGESNQGEMVRRELGRVKEGVDDGIVKDMLKSEPGVVEGAHDDDKEEVLGNVAEEESTPPNTSSATLGQDLSPKSKSKAQVEQGSTASSPGVEEMLEMKTHSNTTANAGATAGAGAVSNAPSAKKRPGMGGRGKSQFEKQEAAAKERGKEGVRIGFFLHTPFPSSEIYR